MEQLFQGHYNRFSGIMQEKYLKTGKVEQKIYEKFVRYSIDMTDLACYNLTIGTEVPSK